MNFSILSPQAVSSRGGYPNLSDWQKSSLQFSLSTSILFLRLAPDHVSAHNNLGTLLDSNEVLPFFRFCCEAKLILLKVYTNDY